MPKVADLRALQAFRVRICRKLRHLWVTKLLLPVFVQISHIKQTFYLFLPQHFLYFLPLPQGHLSFGYIFPPFFCVAIFKQGSSFNY